MAACGSGGFLLHALDHVRRKAGQTRKPGTLDHFQYWHEFAAKNLFGLESNEELARVAKMNMIINHDRHTNIVGHDALDFFRQPIFWRDIQRGFAIQAVYVVVFLAAAWANFATRDITT